MSRRTALLAIGLVSCLLGRTAFAEDEHDHGKGHGRRTQEADGARATVITPNGASLPWKMVDGVKVFHLVAEPVRWTMGPGLVVDGWGYNGRSPGPTIEAVEGDRVRIYVTNRLPEATSVHWHGVLLPNGMDGVGGVTQPVIRPGETYRYELTLRQSGTQMYHPHTDEMVQIGLGMMGLFVVHPKESPEPRVDRDFAILLHEWDVPPGSSRPNPTTMLDFNLFTFNGVVFPATEALVVKKGERVRLRIGNLSMDSHPIHLHGFHFRVTGTDGGPVPETARRPESTVDVPVGATRDVEFVADEPGDWLLHCHKTHHMMNQMAHDLPNVLGVPQRDLEERIRRLIPGWAPMGETGMAHGPSAHGEGHGGAVPLPRNTLPMTRTSPGPFGPLDLGGMVTVLKVREGIETYDDPGWYRHPPGTLAREATREELERDGVAAEGADTEAPKEAPQSGHEHHGH